ncbi:MAG TPA: glucosamine-6-phosphate deaminase [Cyclobacteriaceae bacterium]|nr:glucosamine-6-phosphate deaminase [Cyclobacteriaceae bacterium]
MKILVFKNYEELSKRAAEEIASTIEAKPNAVICLASGDSPRRTCEIFVQEANQKRLDLSGAHFVGLDEWVGVSPDDPGSCQYFLRHNIINPLNVDRNHFHLFNVMASDLRDECLKMDNTISQLGGVDIMVVGIGMNGHIGFNEPGVAPDLFCHVAELDDTTQEVGQKYFTQKKELKMGITLGLAHLTHARKALLLASGIHKAPIVSRAFQASITNQVPASILQTHPNSLILLDEDAASNLVEKKKKCM